MASLPEGTSVVSSSTGDIGVDAKGLLLQSVDSHRRLGLQEQGTNPEWQLCPDYGLDSKEFVVSGSTEYSWVKTVNILSTEGVLLGTMKRGCPSVMDSFSWTVPKAQAEGCRTIEPAAISEVDPTVVAPDCQELERQVLYTDQSGGLFSRPSVKVMDCHDDLLFEVYEERRDLYVGSYMIHSDFVVEDKTGQVMGFCKLDSPLGGLKEIGGYNFTIVDLAGREIAKATRPLRWAGGAKSHAWHVRMLDAEGEADQQQGGVGVWDMRVVAVAVANNVLRHQPSDLCSDVVLALLPMACTLALIGLFAGFHAASALLAPKRRS
eukprot:CAMPEP_0113667014 /NCGR_PEP_ID=MMETSP0038_2-20120614/3202_1 /TAXON_ID=2898 /ORGANISM="Cryptomonas paramecium" /LENGTH=320 /DNA_ID=CAMNT_0000582585 /DNA_START=401 /DNA_END=1363 /DNA_ORIENTATION=+ /assembly_acc=CAM_ASM_000170